MDTFNGIVGSWSWQATLSARTARSLSLWCQSQTLVTKEPWGITIELHGLTWPKPLPDHNNGLWPNNGNLVSIYWHSAVWLIAKTGCFSGILNWSSFILVVLLDCRLTAVEKLRLQIAVRQHLFAKHSMGCDCAGFIPALDCDFPVTPNCIPLFRTFCHASAVLCWVRLMAYGIAWPIGKNLQHSSLWRRGMFVQGADS